MIVLAITVNITINSDSWILLFWRARYGW